MDSAKAAFPQNRQVATGDGNLLSKLANLDSLACLGGRAPDENWPKIRLENIETEEERLVMRLISNALLLTLEKLEKRGRGNGKRS